jgi:hypothetical protein
VLKNSKQSQHDGTPTHPQPEVIPFINSPSIKIQYGKQIARGATADVTETLSEITAIDFSFKLGLSWTSWKL